MFRGRSRRPPESNRPKKRRLPGELTKREAWKKKVQERADASQKQQEHEESNISSIDAFQSLLGCLNKGHDKEVSSSDDDEVVKEANQQDNRFSKEEIPSESEITEELLISSAEEDDDDEEHSVKDPFVVHFENDYGEKFFNEIKKNPPTTSTDGTLKSLGDYFLKGRDSSLTPMTLDRNLKNLHIKSSLTTNFQAELKNVKEEKLCVDFLSLIGRYPDVLYLKRKYENGDAFRSAYCLHILNHLLKVRQRVLKNNAKFEKARLSKSKADIEIRDQRFTRPRVLILLPFRESARKVVQTLSTLLFGEKFKGQTIQMVRFMNEFSSNEEPRDPTGKKPAEFSQTFEGNIDDSFRIGLAVTKKSLKLYTDFYESDIIISSPLSLRMKVKGDNQDADYDFLSSIEIVILDQSDVFLMQNWEHVIEIMKLINLQPKESRGIDFSRVKMYSLDGLGDLYRQFIVLSATPFNEVISLFHRHSVNFEGRIVFSSDTPLSEASISRVYARCPQVFIRHECKSLMSCADDRFDFFTNHILPEILDEPHVMIYISSYFDFVRLRNYLKKEDVNFLGLCEYTKEGKIAQGRSQFFYGGGTVLYTERLHFYRRFQIKGVRRLIFYQLPSLPYLYPQLCNFLVAQLQGIKFNGDESNFKITSLFCPYDLHRLSAIVGSEKASKMMKNRSKTSFSFSSA